MVVQALVAFAIAARADDEPPPSQSAASLPHRIELRRQASERGTPEETTKTTLRYETSLSGVVTRLRLDLQFPDEKTSFSGDPFEPAGPG